MRRRLAGDYDEVNAPQMLDKSLWRLRATGAGTARTCSPPNRRATRRRTTLVRHQAMNCPGHVQIFKHGLKSYRDLPIRLAEFGLVHRYEPSGALHGLLRVRASPRTMRTFSAPKTSSPRNA